MRYLIIPLLPLFLIGCFPHRLVPYDYSIEKHNLEAFIELDSFTVALTNLKVKGDHYVFGMEIENKSNQSIFVQMDKVAKYARDFSYRDNEKGYMEEVARVMTPEQVNKFFKAKQQSGEAAAFMFFLIGAAISTVDAVNDNQNDSCKDQDNQSGTGDILAAGAFIASDILTDVSLQASEAAQTELRYLPAELFDREIIYPGESYYGKILFKRVSEMKDFHRITVPVEGKRLHFDFRKASRKEREFLSNK